MKYAILGTGLFAGGLFIYSVYTFAVNPQGFKPVAYSFLGLTIVFFILVFIRKIREDRAFRREKSPGEYTGTKKNH